MNITRNEKSTQEFVKWIRRETKSGINHSNTGFIASKLGAHVEDHQTRFLLWHPKIKEARHIYIEFFIPINELLFAKPEQQRNATYHLFEATCINEFAVAVIEHLPVGNREQFGAFYQFALYDDEDQKTVIFDPMAWSLPYGIHAPAEVYDIEQVLESRQDKSYFEKLRESFSKKESNRIDPSTNLLEIHTGTTTLEGSLESLSNRYKQIASAIINEEELSADEKNLIGFDAVELMPIDPVIEHPGKHIFWRSIQQPTKNGDEITLHLKKPTITNWGYDVVIFGCSAINPSLLSTGRPHEFLDLIETLHNFPTGSIKVILDVVYGHADNQVLDLLPEEFFAGPNAYGRNINIRHPFVRAIILEMQRRKMKWGIDGLRVDSSHDLKYYDAATDEVHYDDEFLKQMSDVEVDVAGVSYKPWMIFEDGRPWPRTGWKLTANYRSVTEKQNNAYQWAPTIFAYNTPYTYTYWVSKWWRLKELLLHGEKWISGYANHDTMRRATQADPESVNVNDLLGNSLKMVMTNAYNHPSTTLLMNAFLPGVPMDFVQALGNLPWGFFRNTDTDYAVKIVADEAYFSEWQISDVEYRNSRLFKKLKNLGFRSLEELRRFAKTLLCILNISENNLENIVELLNQVEPPFSSTDWTVKKLMNYAAAWMEDIYEYCNVDIQADYIDSKKSDFNLKTRQYRLNNKWLNRNFHSGDFLKFREPVEGAVIYYGYRKDMQTGKEIIFLANMEGQSRQIAANQLDLPINNPDSWNIALSTPSVRVQKIDHPFRLSISQGVLFERKV